MSLSKLDERDLSILTILCREGRLPSAKLAERVNLSATACWSRLQRLERSGVIRGYRAELAVDKVAAHIMVFVSVELESHTSTSFETFERGIGQLDEIVACWAVGGGIDYLLQVITTDIDTYQQLIESLLADELGISRYFTYIVTKPVKHDGVMPVARLLAAAAES